MTLSIMKTKNQKTPAEVYAKIRSQIDRITQGEELTRSEVEVTHARLTYWVDFTMTRHFNSVWHDYDSEPDDRSASHLSINDHGVYNSAGEPATTDFDPEMITEKYDITCPFLD